MQETKQIKYTDGYKYMLEEDAWFYTGIMLEEDFVTKRVIHYKNGWMKIKEDFAWDGCSGPTIDDDTNTRACLFHDGMYYLHRNGFPLKYRIIGDNKLRDLMIEDGACKFIANSFRFAVQNFGNSSAEPKNKRKVLVSPKVKAG